MHCGVFRAQGFFMLNPLHESDDMLVEYSDIEVTNDGYGLSVKWQIGTKDTGVLAAAALCKTFLVPLDDLLNTNYPNVGFIKITPTGKQPMRIDFSYHEFFDYVWYHRAVRSRSIASPVFAAELASALGKERRGVMEIVWD